VTSCVAEPGSFRDPSGHVFLHDGRVFRTVTDRAVADFEFVRTSGVLEEFAAAGRIVESREIDLRLVGAAGAGARHVLEHPRLPYVSFPYEWPFSALKAAALLHLDLHLDLLERDITLSDASAYNVQFLGARPLFIDVLSLRRYRDGEYWLGHRQFCEQFLNPLLLRALLGVPHNAWYRGSLEGLSASDLTRLLPLRSKLSWKVLSHVVLQAKLDRKATLQPERSIDKVRQGRLSKTAFRGLLTQLRGWIARLQPADTGPTAWSDYADTHTYGSDEEVAKRRFVAEFVQQTRPRLMFDLGCNVGHYAVLALEAGARDVIGFDFDQRVLDGAFARAAREERSLLPLFLDAANPSPDQGWQQAERAGFAKRAPADALLALAFEHHLAIGRNVPLAQLLPWLTGLAPAGVIEFVPKSDPTVQRMLALREDIFTEYDQETFRNCLAENARIVRDEVVSQHGRRLFWYDRH
jgi:ribosomal protein L11 methylase PrmA